MSYQDKHPVILMHKLRSGQRFFYEVLRDIIPIRKLFRGRLFQSSVAAGSVRWVRVMD